MKTIKIGMEKEGRTRIKEPIFLDISPAGRVAVGLFLSLVSAALVTLSMPPYGIWPLAILGFLPMILAQYRILPERMSSLASAITIGGLVGFYIMDAFLNLPGAPWYMRLLPVLFGLFVLLTDSKTRKFHELTNYRWLVLNGALGWVGVEMIRGFIPMLGTWGFISYSYFKQPWLIQPVSIFGIYGLSLVNMLAGYSLGMGVLYWFDRRWKLREDQAAIEGRTARNWLMFGTLVFLLWGGLSLILIKPSSGDMIKVAAVQTGFKNLWYEDEIESNSLSFDRFVEIYEQHLPLLIDQTRELIGQDIQVITWPEGALDFDPQIIHTAELQELAADLKAYLVIPYGVDYRNEVTVLSPDGKFLGVYGKNHPVLFVNEISTTHGIYPAYQTEVGDIGTIICYDLDFTDTARNVANSGANLIAVPSGDWPGIADKHYAHLVMRAVENRVAMIKADRSYDSAIIDPYGRILALTSSKEALASTITAAVSLLDQDTIQQQLGDWMGWISLGGMMFFAIYTPITLKRDSEEVENV